MDSCARGRKEGGTFGKNLQASPLCIVNQSLFLTIVSSKASNVSHCLCLFDTQRKQRKVEVFN